MAIENFAGYRTRELQMPDGGKVVCFFYVPIDSPNKSGVEDGNRNVFRVDKDGHVMWQITRVDYPDTNWESKHEHARERGLPGCIEPFIAFRVYRADHSVIKEFGPPDQPNAKGEYEYWGLDEYRKLRKLVTKKPPPPSETLPDVVRWEPGYQVELQNLGIGTQWFRLDVDTGVAVEITPRGHRPW